MNKISYHLGRAEFISPLQFNYYKYANLNFLILMGEEELTKLAQKIENFNNIGYINDKKINVLNLNYKKITDAGYIDLKTYINQQNFYIKDLINLIKIFIKLKNNLENSQLDVTKIILNLNSVFYHKDKLLFVYLPIYRKYNFNYKESENNFFSELFFSVKELKYISTCNYKEKNAALLQATSALINPASQSLDKSLEDFVRFLENKIEDFNNMYNYYCEKFNDTYKNFQKENDKISSDCIKINKNLNNISDDKNIKNDKNTKLKRNKSSYLIKILIQISILLLNTSYIYFKYPNWSIKNLIILIISLILVMQFKNTSTK